MIAIVARHGGLDSADIAIRDEQIVAACIRGHDYGAGRNQLRDHIGRQGIFLRLTANVALLVIFAGLKVRAIELVGGVVVASAPYRDGAFFRL